VGQTYSKEVNIESNCPINFEFEFKEIKPHPDIRVSQLAGDIIGNQSNPITFSYFPSTFTTAEAEY
jgi:hypothetical protein